MTKRQIQVITSICEETIECISCDTFSCIDKLVNLNPIFNDFKCTFDDDFAPNQLPIIITTLCYWHNQLKKQQNDILLRTYTDACDIFMWNIGQKIIDLNQNTDFAKYCFDKLQVQFYPNL